MTTRMPPLQTKRLLVRRFVPQDLDAVHVILDRDFDQTDANKGLGREERERWLRWAIANEEQLSSLYQPPYGDRAVVLTATEQVIGVCGLVPYIDVFGRVPSMGTGDPQKDALATAEVGLFWALAREHRGKGHATEAGQALVHYAFHALHLQRLIATTTYDNTASIAVMERLGMTVDRNPGPDPPHMQVVGVLRNPAWSP